MTLLEKQQTFSVLLARLIDKAIEMGFEVTMGETWRHPEMAAIYAKKGLGIKNSLHVKRLAVDLNLFLDKKYLTDSAFYQPLGEWWEGQNKLARWGGRFKNRDGNHFSLEHEGVK